MAVVRALIDRLRAFIQRWLELDLAAARLAVLEETKLDLSSIAPMVQQRLTPIRNDVTALAAEVAKLKQPLERRATQQDAETDPHLGRL